MSEVGRKPLHSFLTNNLKTSKLAVNYGVVGVNPTMDRAILRWSHAICKMRTREFRSITLNRYVKDYAFRTSDFYIYLTQVKRTRTRSGATYDTNRNPMPFAFALCKMGTDHIYIDVICAMGNTLRGAGKAMFEELKRVAKSMGMKGLLLRTLSEPKPVYVKWGFHTVDLKASNKFFGARMKAEGKKGKSIQMNKGSLRDIRTVQVSDLVTNRSLDRMAIGKSKEKDGQLMVYSFVKLPDVSNGALH